MCTAITFKTIDNYFGRTLDNPISYNEEVIITPRHFPFKLRNGLKIENHFAIIGMACCLDNYPLYYDAMNEKGLAIAGLNFINSCCYHQENKQKNNISQFEFIPLILSSCTSVKQAKALIKKINFVNVPFNEQLPLAKLHWIIADSKECIVVESMSDNLKIYDNKVGVLTNEPPFDFQMFNLNNYLNLTSNYAINRFNKKIKLNNYSLGMGGLGLPGDNSSQSRFVRIAFNKLNCYPSNDELSSVNQFFHLLSSVNQIKGTSKTKNNNNEMTIYSSCCNLNKGLYYYTTYNNHQINSIDMHKEALESSNLIKFKLIQKENINHQN